MRSSGGCSTGYHLRATQATALSPQGLLNPRPQQAANLPRQEIRSADGSVCPLQHGASHCYHSPLPSIGGQAHLALMLHLTELSVSHACSPSSFLSLLNVFHNCRSSGGAGAFLLLPEVTSFQLLQLWASISQSDAHRALLLWYSWNFGSPSCTVLDKIWTTPILSSPVMTNGVPVELLLGTAVFLFGTRGLQGLLKGSVKYVLNFSRCHNWLEHTSHRKNVVPRINFRFSSMLPRALPHKAETKKENVLKVLAL